MSDKELRELDAWIAERVMGMPKPDVVWDDGIYYKHGNPGMSLLKKYSPTTDPAAAMQVLEKCCQRMGGNVEVAICQKSGRWFVGEVDWDSEMVYPQSEAKTLPLAIGLFAKKLFST